jgi:sterol desaturase/sphingolipid hydroxylase (fatty acid hydroxylase superfamily)
MPKSGIWSRSHYLNKMSLRDLVVAYFQYYAIQAYLVLAAVCGWFAWTHPTTPARGFIAAAFAVAVYPIAWYVLHRWVLHGRWMWRFPALAPAWKRIHYDHHQDPNHLEVLFGALYTTLPTIVIATLPVGWLIGGGGSLAGPAGGAAAIALMTGLLVTCFYEFCHCIQHLTYKPRAKFLADMKARHMAHHFHDEDGNFGITNFMMDRLLGTFYERDQRPYKSPTVFNLGYTDEVAKIYPWVANLSGGVAAGHPRQRQRASD